MTEMIQIGDLSISVTRKEVKNVHLSVYPPDGQVKLVAPTKTRLDVARAYAISRLTWIHEQQRKLREQARETPREFVERESHFVWGRRYLMVVKYEDAKPAVSLDHKRVTLTLRPGSDQEARAQVMHEWHKSLLHKVIPKFISKWEPRLNVQVNKYFLQRMKTKWGSCNHRSNNIRFNTELVKKPKDLVEYIVVHEMAHLIEPTHNDRFVSLLNEHCPRWREARIELNELPLTSENWQDKNS